MAVTLDPDIRDAVIEVLKSAIKLMGSKEVAMRCLERRFVRSTRLHQFQCWLNREENRPFSGFFIESNTEFFELLTA